MVRGTNLDKEEIRKKILSTVKEMIVNDGYKNLNARAIAAEVGCAVGSLYNIFGSLDDMILSVNSRTLDILFAELEDSIRAHESAKIAIEQFATGYVSFAHENEHLWSALFEYTYPEDKEMPRWYIKKIDRIFTLAKDIMLPIFDSDDEKADMVAKVIWAGLHGICSLSISGKLRRVRAESADKLADSFIESYLKGVVKEHNYW